MNVSLRDMEQRIGDTIARIGPPDEAAARAAQAREDSLTKPPGSLGRLEEIAIRLAGITGSPIPQIQDKVVIVMAADHGVVHEGVSAYPQAVTAQMVMNFLAGGAAINVLARQASARLQVVDMGVSADLPENTSLSVRKIGRGTQNLAHGPAMSRAEAAASVVCGIEIAEEEIGRGADLLATGDMGIGNSTSAAAIACALMGRPPEELSGRGTGIDDASFARKVGAIRAGIRVNHPDPKDGLDVLSKLGGFEIGGLAGVILASAAAQLPIVVDGYISTAAAMIATSLAPGVREGLFAAHASAEHGHEAMLDWLGAQPLLRLNMRLGEGTGAVLAMGIIESAARILKEMATFDEAGVQNKSH
jgi:nicotinate-nucleotide--dimethylbenzimidazole phosphoribosyltransferase